VLVAPKSGTAAEPPLPLPACGERSEFAHSSRKFRVRVRLRESEHIETPPHPDPLHSPSKTGVNALMASGEREQKARRAPYLRVTRKLWHILPRIQAAIIAIAIVALRGGFASAQD